MAKDTVTLVLNGEVTLADYASVVGGLIAMMSALGDEIAKDAKIEWIVEELEAGSATTMIRGQVENAVDFGHVENIVEAFGKCGIALQSRRPIPYQSAAGPASRITAVLNGRITSLTFNTDDVDAEVSTPDLVDGDGADAQEATKKRDSFGTVRGRVQAMNQRRGRRFTLYELNTDRAVLCYYEAEMEPKVIANYGQVVVVEGWVRRNPASDQPTSIRNVTDIGTFPIIDRSAYRKARGVAPGIEGNPSAEDAIRKVRDG